MDNKGHFFFAFCITDDKTEFFNAIAGDFEGFEGQDNKAVAQVQVHLEEDTHRVGGILEVVEDNNLVGGMGTHLVGQVGNPDKA